MDPRKEVSSAISSEARHLRILLQILVHSAVVLRMVRREVEVEARARLELMSRLLTTISTSSEGSASREASALEVEVVGGLAEAMVPLTNLWNTYRVSHDTEH